MQGLECKFRGAATKATTAGFCSLKKELLTLGPRLLCTRPRYTLQSYFIKHVSNVLFGDTMVPNMGGCQNYVPFLGTLNIRCRIIIGIQKGTIILTTPHIE